MSEKNNAAVDIEQLNLQVPGTSVDAGHRLVTGIGQSLAQRIPAGMQGRIGALSVRVQVPAGASEAETSDAIAGAIMNALQKGHPR